MKLVLDLPAELVADLRDRARRSGVDVAAEVESLLSVAFEVLADVDGGGLADGDEEPPFDVDREDA